MSHTAAEAPTSRLSARGLGLAYGSRTVVDDLAFSVPDGAVTAIVGPNGCGKSTLLRGLARLLRPTEGQVVLDGHDISTLPTKEVARRVGLLPQSPLVPEGITVAELVSRGRAPHHGLLRQWTRADDVIVAESLDLTDTSDLAGRDVDALSGGQRQRVWIAMILAQRTGILLLDEPTSFLDIAHQVEVLDLIDDLHRERGTTVVMVLHDLGMAARYAHHLVAMRDGRIVAQGPPADIITPEVVEDVFGIGCSVLYDDATGTPIVVPHRRARRETSTDHHPTGTGEEHDDDRAEAGETGRGGVRETRHGGAASPRRHGTLLHGRPSHP